MTCCLSGFALLQTHNTPRCLDCYRSAQIAARRGADSSARVTDHRGALPGAFARPAADAGLDMCYAQEDHMAGNQAEGQRSKDSPTWLKWVVGIGLLLLVIHFFQYRGAMERYEKTIKFRRFADQHGWYLGPHGEKIHPQRKPGDVDPEAPSFFQLTYP